VWRGVNIRSRRCYTGYKGVNIHDHGFCVCYQQAKKWGCMQAANFARWCQPCAQGHHRPTRPRPGHGHSGEAGGGGACRAVFCADRGRVCSVNRQHWCAISLRGLGMVTRVRLWGGGGRGVQHITDGALLQKTCSTRRGMCALHVSPSVS
jgi:hypothetical protein